MDGQEKSSGCDSGNEGTSPVIEFIIKYFGFVPHVYQTEFLENCVLNKRICAVWCRQSGKCLGKDVKVIMFDGAVKKVQDIQVGDLLMGDDSMPRKVLSVTKGFGRLYKVMPKSAYAKGYVVNEEHILSLKNRRKTKRTGNWRKGGKRIRLEDKIAEMSVKEWLKLSNYQKIEKYCGYKVGVDFLYKKVKIEPYWLGLWLGDGSSYDVKITSKDKEIICYLEEYAKRLRMKFSVYSCKNKCNDYSITNGIGSYKSNILRKFLRDENLIKNKHIPNLYKINNRKIRLELLAGIIDADGYKPKSKKGINTCEIVLTNKILANDVLFLAQSLGFRVSIKKKRCTIKSIGFKGTAYRIHLYGELWKIPIKVQRKKYTKRVLREKILNYQIGIKEIGKGEYYGFELDGNKRFLLEDFTVTHNTESIALYCLFMALSIPDTKILIVAPTQRQSGELFLRTRKWLLKKNVFLRYITRQTQTVVEFENSSRITSLPCGHDGSTIRGQTANILIMEEAGYIKDSIVNEVLTPMIAATDGQIIKIGTGRSKNHFWESCYGREAKNYWLSFIDYKRALAEKQFRLEFINEQLENLTSLEFDTEYGAKFIEDSDAYFKQDLLQSCIEDIQLLSLTSHPPNPKNEYVMGVDLARLGEDSSVFIIIEKDWIKQSLKVVYIIETKHKLLTDAIGRIKNIDKEFNLKRIIVDETGLGAGVFDVLKEALGFKVEGITFTVKSKQDIYSNLKMHMESGRLKFPYHKKLFYELSDLRYELASSGDFKLHHSERGHDDYPSALALACSYFRIRQKYSFAIA